MSTDRALGARTPGTIPSLARSSMLDGPRLRPPTTSTYARHVLVHPYNLLFLGTFFLSSLMGTSLPILLGTLIIEAALLLLFPRLAWVRSVIDAGLYSRDRNAAAQVRAALAPHMDPPRRQELLELERRVDALRTNSRRDDSNSTSLLEHVVELDRLLGGFVRLAVIHRAIRESLALTDRAALRHDAETVERQLEHAPPEPLRHAMMRRLVLLRRRLARFDQNRQRLDTMAHQLSSIAEMIRLVHDQSLALFGSSSATTMVERVLLELEDHEEALQELVELCVAPDAQTGAEEEQPSMQSRMSNARRVRLAV